MQVKRLIELLSGLDPEAYVFVGSTSADAMLGDVTAPYAGAVRLLADDDFVEAETDHAWQTGHSVGVEEAADCAYRRGYDRGFKDYPDHPYDPTPTV